MGDKLRFTAQTVKRKEKNVAQTVGEQTCSIENYKKNPTFVKTEVFYFWARREDVQCSPLLAVITVQ